MHNNEQVVQAVTNDSNAFGASFCDVVSSQAPLAILFPPLISITLEVIHKVFV